MNIHNSIAYFKGIFKSDEKPDVVFSKEDMPFHIEYADDFSIFFLCDTGDKFEMVQQKHLDEAKITRDEILNIGVLNLSNIAKNIEIKKNNGVLYFIGNGNFEASMLLVDEIWSNWLNEHCPNGYIAAIPARDILAVCDKNYVEGIKKISSIIDQIWPDGDHLLSRRLYTKNENIWIPHHNA